MKHKLIILMLACAGLARAADHYVGNVQDLTNALAGASSNDTVWLSNGTYGSQPEYPSLLRIRASSITAIRAKSITAIRGRVE